MAFSSAVVTNTGKKGTNAWLTHLEGTWNAASVTLGTIDLSSYLSRIDAGAVFTLTGTGATRWGLNMDSARTAALGKIGIIHCTSNDTGGWWAEGPMA